MRMALISLLIITLILTFPFPQVENSTCIDSTPNLRRTQDDIISKTAVEGSGDPLSSNLYISRMITSERISILNTYADTSLHSGIIDLSNYLEPGWHIYKVEINVTKMEAAPEREAIAQINENSNFRIEDIGIFISELAQGFYEQPHDGQLMNYSIYYRTFFYNPSQRGNASFAVTSNYNTSSIMTAPVNMTASESVARWVVLDGENAALDANTIYWAIINGSTLYEGGIPSVYPEIDWLAQDNEGQFGSYRRTPAGWEPSSPGLEALLRYTYTPWNRTAGSALQFSSPERLSLQADSVAQTGRLWTITNAVSNITSIQFNTNQSIYLDYNITIWYQDSPTVTTNWHIDISGNPVVWNATTTISYPVFPETTAEFLDLTVQSDWTIIGLYNSTYSGTDYGHYSRVGDMVTCTAMADETWILSCSAPNYVTDLSLSDSLDSSPIAYYVDILVDMDIDATIEDGIGTPMTGGLTNLTVTQAGVGIFKPGEIAASAGTASFTWYINSTTSSNGTHFVEIFWTNGVEAGYLVEEVFVYYPTTLVADDITIDAYAENSFDIGVNFDQDFPIRGLDDTLADVEYSFDGGANTSLIDQTGGRWTATISTAGKTDGTYLLYVYAEGYALENQSLTITVNLIFETLPLNWSWSNTDNITYTNSTSLSISYLMQDGITRISGATVTVTIEGVPYDMTWDSPSETYWIELTGGNFSGVGTFTLNVSASKVGYEGQNRAINITIRSETTGLYFQVDYNPDNRTISFIETLFIQVTYNFNSVPIDSNTVVRVFFNGSSPVSLIYNDGSLKWETTLRGSNYLGAWNIIVRATADGYATHENTTELVVYEDTPIVSNSWIDSAATTDYVTAMPLSITLTMSNGTPINDANISFTAFSSYHELLSGVAGVYTFNINPNETRGIESFTVIVVRTGYVTNQMTLELTVEATTSLTFSHSTYSEFEEWDITISASYMDTHYNQPITEASVNISFGGRFYVLQYNNVSELYYVTITLDLAPGDYTINAYASAEYAAYAEDTSSLTITAKDTLYITITFAPPRVVAGQFMEVRATVMSNYTGTLVAVQGEPIYFAITITYANGTIIHYEDVTMFDTTNSEGVATYGFDVPQGQIESLTAKATFIGTRERWSAETTETTGVEVSIFALVFSFLTSEIGLMIIFSIALLGIVATGYNRGVKPRKRAARRNLENQLQMFKDLETVRHFMAVYLDRGTCVFYHPFTEERIQPDLISGFIAAITSVYGEIKGDGVRGTLEEIQYHGLRLNSYSGEYIIGILILEGEMTPLLRERLQFFVELFENQYDQDLDGWTGLVDCFDPEWVVSTLNSAFNYAWHLPHRFGPTQKVNKTDTKILDYISAARDDKNEFYIRNLLTPLAEMLEKTEAEVLDRLLLFQDRGIIVPIGVQTILQRQGLALVNGSEQPLQEPPAKVKKEVTKKEPVPDKTLPEPVEELEFEELVEKTVEEPVEKKVTEPEPEVDEMEAFVQDVESLLVEQSKEKKKKDDELEKFADELRDKIGEDEDTKE